MINYPKLNRNATNRVMIPLLDGGINLSDGCTHIGDNQLIDAKNVWFDGQTLKTRPKVDKIVNRQFGASADDNNVGDYFAYVYSKWVDKNIYTHISIYYRFSEGTLNLYALINDLDDFSTTSYKAVANELSGLSSDINSVKVNSYKGTPNADNGTGIYVLVGLYGADRERGGLIYEISNENGANLIFKEIYKNVSEFSGASGVLGTETDELYKPLVYFNGKGNKYNELPITSETEYSGAVTYEGKNLLPSAIRFKMMSDGLSTAYTLPAEIDKQDKIIVNLNIAGFEFTEVKKDGEYYTNPILKFTKYASSSYNRTDGYTVNVDGVSKTIAVDFYSDNSFEFIDVDNNKTLVLPITQTSDNIEVIAYKTNWEDYEKILNMTVHTQYGGGSGIFGGSRVFLGGYKNFICFSTTKNTYFSENNYIGVGDSSQVTAFGKMNDLLVIFKPNSIYATQTTYSDSVTAEQIQSGSAGDVATSYCYFPIYQLTDEVGCDIPNSIRLCLNRLIFANTSNNIYCLVTQNNASQRNVYCLSEQIKKKLTLDKTAFSASFNDYYLLICNNRVYVLNYNKDSYRYIYSYTNRTNNTSSRYLTWWYWELEQNDVNYFMAASHNDNVYLINKKSLNKTDKTLDVCYYRLNPDESDENCEVIVETKVFDFSIPERYKKIEKLYIGIGNDKYSEINLTINTDKGEVYNRPLIVSDDGSKSTADYGEEIRLIPYCNKVRQFNIKLEAYGIMSLESLSIYYKQLGEVMS